MIDFDKIGEEIRQILRKLPLTDINIVVRDREIFASAKPNDTPDMVRFKRIGIHVRAE